MKGIIITGLISLEQAKWLHDKAFTEQKTRIKIVRELIEKAMKESGGVD